MSRFNAAGRPASQTYTSCVTGSRTSRLDLSGLARPVDAACRHTHDTLLRWGLASDLIDHALLIASELVTNADQQAAGGGAQEIRLTLQAGQVSIAVSDAIPGHRSSAVDNDVESRRVLSVI
ncbi:ATP-binding protein [Actinomadura viridis]|uniref:ATP-binding protein n=1 Tax=Actinomadura viridis TaxID=58110 RepID=UPI0036CC0F4B